MAHKVHACHCVTGKEFGHGAQWGDGWHGYVAGTWFDEDGWRERSPGNLGNLFLKLGRNLGDTSWALSYSYGRSNLIGNGLQAGRGTRSHV